MAQYFRAKSAERPSGGGHAHAWRAFEVVSTQRCIAMHCNGVRRHTCCAMARQRYRGADRSTLVIVHPRSTRLSPTLSIVSSLSIVWACRSRLERSAAEIACTIAEVWRSTGVKLTAAPHFGRSKERLWLKGGVPMAIEPTNMYTAKCHGDC